MPASSSRALSSRDKVLRAARALFAARGFHGTSTRDVARRARVNEITVFRLFKNKQDLYLQVLDQVSAGVPHWFDAVLASPLAPQQAFLALAERLRELLEPGLIRLLCIAAVEKPELMKKGFRSGLICLDAKLAAHLDKCVEHGTLRNLEPALMGRALVAMVACQQVIRSLLCEELPAQFTNAAEVYTDIWLHGVLPSSGLGSAAGESDVEGLICGPKS
jgi:AcrR family transcriptional regulator